MAREYNIAKTSGACTACEKELPPGASVIAVVRETPDEFVREDYCVECWQAERFECGDDVVGNWQTQVPQPEQKKKLFIDDAMLINFFERLAETEDESRLAFRYVLALVLMRKKLLVYDRAERDDDGREIWLMHFKGSDERQRVVDPHLDENRIAEVSEQLGQILEGEL